MDMIDVEACKRSRYLSLHFRMTAPALLHDVDANEEDRYAPDHQPKFLLLRIRICPKHAY